VNVVLGRIELLAPWKHVETRSVKNGFIERVALATIIGADTDAFVDIDTVTYTLSLSPRQDL
jgi:hypothetical protein